MNSETRNSVHDLMRVLLAVHAKVHPDAKQERGLIAKRTREALEKHDFGDIVAAFSTYLATRTPYLVDNEHPIPVFLNQIDEWVEKSKVKRGTSEAGGPDNFRNT